MIPHRRTKEVTTTHDTQGLGQDVLIDTQGYCKGTILKEVQVWLSSGEKQLKRECQQGIQG